MSCAMGDTVQMFAFVLDRKSKENRAPLEILGEKRKPVDSCPAEGGSHTLSVCTTLPCREGPISGDQDLPSSSRVRAHKQ